MFFDLEPYKKYIVYNDFNDFNDFIRGNEHLISLLINKASIIGVGCFGDNSFTPNAIEILLKDKKIFYCHLPQRKRKK